MTTPRIDFSQQAAAELFRSYLTHNNFTPLPHDAGNAAMQEILQIDYRPYLRHPNFIDIYKQSCVEILVKHGSTPENAAIFAGAIVYLTNPDNGFADAMKQFIDRFVRIDTTPPPEHTVSPEFPDSYGRIALEGFDPEVHITKSGAFDFSPPPRPGVRYHDPKTGLDIVASATASMGVLVTVSGPITPAVLVVGAAIVVGAVVLRKLLKDSC